MILGFMIDLTRLKKVPEKDYRFLDKMNTTQLMNPEEQNEYAHLERERILVSVLKAMKFRFMEEWFEVFRTVSGVSMLDFIKNENRLEYFLNSFMLSFKLLKLYRNLSTMQALYTLFFSKTNEICMEEIIYKKVN